MANDEKSGGILGIELSGHTRIVTQLGALLAVLGVLVGAALWADDVSDSLRDINKAIQDMRGEVVGIDGLSLRRSVMNSWLREMSVEERAWVEKFRALNRALPLEVPDRNVPALPPR